MGDDDAVHTPPALYVRLHSWPRLQLWLVVCAILVPALWAFVTAIAPREAEPQFFILIASIGLVSNVAARWHRSRPALSERLSRSDRALRERVRFSGVPSGRREIDEAAAAELRKQVQTRRRLTWGFATLIPLAVVSFVVAATRSSPWWWVVGLVDLPLLAALYVPLLRHRPTAALARLSERVGDGPPYPTG